MISSLSFRRKPTDEPATPRAIHRLSLESGRKGDSSRLRASLHRSGRGRFFARFCSFLFGRCLGFLNDFFRQLV
jgi:hypothetical protein